MLTLPLSVVTEILNGPKAFPLFNWDMSLCTPSSLVALSRNEFNELFLRKFLNGLLESRMVFNKLGPILIKKIVEDISNFCRIRDIFTFYFDNV